MNFKSEGDSMRKKYLIVGGVAGGASCATRLRRLDEFAEIIIFEKTDYISISTCSIPYHLSRTIPRLENLVLMTPERFKNQYNIDVKINHEVITVNPKKKTILVKDYRDERVYEENYDYLILAPGAEALELEIPGKDKIPYFLIRNLNDVSRLTQFMSDNHVKHLTVIGGGFIGLEIVEALKSLDINVTLIESQDHILNLFDYEMAQILHKVLLDNNVQLLLDSKVKSFSENTVQLEDSKTITTDGVIFAVGINPATAFLKNTGIELDKKGYIIVNGFYQTNDQFIFAIGDAIKVRFALTNLYEPLPLASSAVKQARLVADYLNGLDVINSGFIGTNVIKVFDYTAAVTGLTENYIKKRKLNYQYETVYLAPSDKVSIMPDAHPIFMKVIYEKRTGKILGAQAIGKGLVEKRIDALSVALKFGGTVRDLQGLELGYAPPYSTVKDPVNLIGYIGDNLNRGRYKQISFMKVRELVNKHAQIIDVREKHEYENGHLIGAKNIPLSELRSRLMEIDKRKPVYVHCRTGARSYSACLILNQHGFNAINIAGGYLFLSYYEDTQRRLDNNHPNILSNPIFN